MEITENGRKGEGVVYLEAWVFHTNFHEHRELLEQHIGQLEVINKSSSTFYF